MAVFLHLPSPATLAAAVRTELAPELARIDVAVSTRATPSDVHVTVDEPPRIEVTG